MADDSILTAAIFRSVAGLVHGFTGRRGGVSTGAFAALNLSYNVGDEVAVVDQNWRTLQNVVGGGLTFVTMRQVHGTEVLTVDAPYAERPTADGLITATPGLALTVMTADCVPILIVAPRHRAVAAVHAGWRGTSGAIVRQAVESMARELGVDVTELLVALGPSIDGCCFEVGAEVGNSFRATWGRLPRSYRVAPNDAAKAFLDLRDANIELLIEAGIAPDHIERVGPCTHCAHDEFYSHRASNGNTGRQAAFIGFS